MNIIYESDGFSEARRNLRAKMDSMNVLKHFEETWRIIRDVADLETARHRFSPNAFRFLQETQEEYRVEKANGFGVYSQEDE
jgi:hypothetical protein